MAIAVGTVETYDAGGSSDADVTITNRTVDAGSNRMFLVLIGKQGTPATPMTGATLNGVACTRLDPTHLPKTDGSFHSAEIWYILEADMPAAGSYTVVIDRAVAHRMGAATLNLSGVNQTTPFDLTDVKHTTGANPTRVINADATQLVLDILAGNSGDSNTPITHTGDQTERVDFVGSAGSGANSVGIFVGTGVGSNGYAASVTYAVSNGYYVIPINEAVAAAGGVGKLINSGLVN
jgi:hypothetical protein